MLFRSFLGNFGSLLWADSLAGRFWVTSSQTRPFNPRSKIASTYGNGAKPPAIHKRLYQEGMELAADSARLASWLKTETAHEQELRETVEMSGDEEDELDGSDTEPM